MGEGTVWPRGKQGTSLSGWGSEFRAHGGQAGSGGITRRSKATSKRVIGTTLASVSPVSKSPPPPAEEGMVALTLVGLRATVTHQFEAPSPCLGTGQWATWKGWWKVGERRPGGN